MEAMILVKSGKDAMTRLAPENKPVVSHALEALAGLGVSRVLISYQYCNQRWLQAIEERGYAATSFPPDPAYPPTR